MSILSQAQNTITERQAQKDAEVANHATLKQLAGKKLTKFNALALQLTTINPDINSKFNDIFPVDEMKLGKNEATIVIGQSLNFQLHGDDFKFNSTVPELSSSEFANSNDALLRQIQRNAGEAIYSCGLDVSDFGELSAPVKNRVKFQERVEQEFSEREQIDNDAHESLSFLRSIASVGLSYTPNIYRNAQSNSFSVTLNDSSFSMAIEHGRLAYSVNSNSKVNGLAQVEPAVFNSMLLKAIPEAMLPRVLTEANVLNEQKSVTSNIEPSLPLPNQQFSSNDGNLGLRTPE